MHDNGVKGICIALIFIDTLVFGWPPYLLVRGGHQTARSVRIRSIIISYLTCFAGGVFLGACLLHLLAEGREVMEEYFDSVGHPDTEFPIYEAVVAGGFFAIAFVEQLAHLLLHNSRRGRKQDNPPGEPACVAAARSQLDGGSFSMKRRVQTLPDPEQGLDNPGHNSLNNGESETGVYILKSDIQVTDGGSNGTSEKFPRSYNNGSVHNKESAGTSIKGEKTDVNNEQLQINNNDNESDHGHDEEMVQIVQVMEVNPLRAFLLLGAMSFHTIFDGLAIGLQEGATDIWEMFIAICIHKSLVAVCLGLQLFLAFKSHPIMGVVWVLVFALISPIGIGIGMILTSGHINSDGEDLTNWILQGLATGTFLYVTIFEILREEFSQRGSITKIFVAILGFGGMAVAKYFDKD